VTGKYFYHELLVDTSPTYTWIWKRGAREHRVKTVYKGLMDKGTQKHFLDELMAGRKFYKLINYNEYGEIEDL